MLHGGDLTRYLGLVGTGHLMESFATLFPSRKDACYKKDLECSSTAVEKENMEAGPRCHTEDTARKKADTWSTEGQ